MTTPMTHAEIESQGYVERYVARRLHGEELERFEIHLLECEECRTEIRLGVAVAGTFRATKGRGWRTLVVAGFGVAATATFFLLVPRTPAGLAALGTIETPPPYDAVEVRGDALQHGESLFVAGASAYRAGAWITAATDLQAAESAGVQGPALPFLLGLSELMAGNAGAADRTLGALVASGGDQYRSEAMYYQAKAKLRLGDGPGALALLRGSDHPPAAPLADSIEALLSR